MKKRKFLVSLLCLSAMLGVSATALTSCKTKPKEPDTPVVEYWTVTIDLNDGSTPTTKQVVKGEKLTGVTEPTREGYTFAGWKANDADWTMNTAITGNITIIAQWTAVPATEYWTVTIDLNDGSIPTTKQVVKGQKLTGVTEPTREGYTFAGWKANDADWTMDTAITGNITIVAQWTENPVTPVVEYWTVTIDLNDGTEPTTKDVVKGEKLTGVGEPTREGYKFTGWKANDADWTMDEAITANITIVAQWTELPPAVEYWTVTIDLNDGSEATTKDVVKGEKLTEVDEPTRDGYKFTGWKANNADWTMDTAITANITIVAQWRKLSDYEAFVSKGNIIYASDFTNLEEVILNSNNIQDYNEVYGKWVGTINDYDDFDDANKVFIQNGYLNVFDDSEKTTYAYLMLNPVYSSVVEVKAVIQPSVLAGSWSIFTLMSPFSSSEYLLNLRTNSAKEICLQTRIYNASKKEYEDSALPTSGFVYVENKDLVIEATVDLNTGEIKVTLSQEGKAKTFTATLDTQGYDNPIAFSGVKVMTAGAASRSIKIDWLGARIVSENVEALKALVLAQLEANYECYDKSEYTQQLELLEKTYADSVAAIEACTTNAEIMKALDEIDEAFEKIKSDSQLEALAIVEEARQELADLKEEYEDFYTITKDSEDDYYSNKESFEELFENALRNLENPWSVEQIQNELDYVRNTLTEEHGWLQNDEAILENYRRHLVDQARNYANENGYTYNWEQVYDEIIAPLEEELVDIEDKAEMRNLYSEYFELFDLIETDEQILARTKQEACTELEEYAELAVEDLNESADAELISLIASIKDNAIIAINNATEINEVYNILNAASNEIGELAGFAGQSLDDIILSAQMELEDYINQKKSNYSQEYALNALDQVWIDHEHDFDELTTVAAVREKLKELKVMVDAITCSNISITYINEDEVETNTYAFG